MPSCGILSGRRMLQSQVNPFLFHQEFLMGQLHDRMAQDLTLRNFSLATACNYLLYGRKFAVKPLHSGDNLGASRPPATPNHPAPF